MSEFIVVVFPDEKKAYEGVHALKELDGEGSLTLYSNAVIQRNAEGRISVKERQADGPVGTAVGALIGGLIGMLAGPVGAAVGVAGGTAIGAFRDLFNLGVSDEFLGTISKELTAGKTAVVAEISEEWVIPLDSRMQAIGGTVMRELRDDFVDDQMQKRIGKLDAELKQRKAELAASRAEKVDTMKKAVSKVEQTLRAAADNAKGRVQHYREETDAKIHALQDQARKAHADAKSRINERIAEIRADQKVRLDKLEQALKLTQEALRP
jgi:uncharacterized membrane protein